ncbi:MAG TPA: DNA-binding protein [Microscillaceae bacterium]|nr:DNA-binding protein [Microscillaceae bacterium]
MSKLAEYRGKLNLTQEELSTKSGVSVRTIQRIESGIPPKGYTLKALAKALDLDEADLQANETTTEQVDYKLVNIINLSSLMVVFIPILNAIVPLVITHTKKQYNPLTKQIITFQVLWSVVIISVFLLGHMLNLGEFGRNSLITFLLFLVLSNVYVILRNSIELNKNKKLYFGLNFSII